MYHAHHKNGCALYYYNLPEIIRNGFLSKFDATKDCRNPQMLLKSAGEVSRIQCFQPHEYQELVLALLAVTKQDVARNRFSCSLWIMVT